MEGEKVLTDKNGEKRYIRGKLLGTGGFAKCFEVRSVKDGSMYAAKVIPKKEINEKRKRYKLLLEIKIHRMFKHENIVRFIEVFEDADNVYIVLEFCPFNTLKELVKRRKRLSEFQTKVYILQMVKALEVIHNKAVIHRDLKLGNILVNSKMQLKLCDFGLSTRSSYIGQRKRTICGTPNYIAPEILEEEGHSYESDIWSLGVIIYTLLYGTPPFQSNTVEQTYENIRENKYSFKDIGVSSEAKDLIKRILTTDPSKRLTIREIMEHRFMVPVEEIPKCLPVYTLAIPHFNMEGLVRSGGMAMEREVEVQMEVQVNKTIYDLNSVGLDDDEEEDNHQGELERVINNEQWKIDFVYVREVLVSEGNMGYILSNGQMGVVISRTNTKLELILSNSKTFINLNGNLKRIKEQYPKEREILDNFVDFFQLKYSNNRMIQGRREDEVKEGVKEGVLFIKKKGLLGEQHLTRLSNDVVQMFFSDLSSLILNLPSDKCLFYITKGGDQLSYEYSSVDSIPDLRLQKKIKKFSKVLSLVSTREPN